MLFQSTLPAWGATLKQPGHLLFRVYFNPRPPHGERPSIAGKTSRRYRFQSTPPHGERRFRFLMRTAPFVFQSTLPAWRATQLTFYLRRLSQYFNPRSPHGERPAHQSEDDDKPHISIHAPAWGATSAAAVA